MNPNRRGSLAKVLLRKDLAEKTHWDVLTPFLLKVGKTKEIEQYVLDLCLGE